MLEGQGIVPSVRPSGQYFADGIGEAQQGCILAHVSSHEVKGRCYDSHQV